MSSSGSTTTSAPHPPATPHTRGATRRHGHRAWSAVRPYPFSLLLLGAVIWLAFMAGYYAYFTPLTVIPWIVGVLVVMLLFAIHKFAGIIGAVVLVLLALVFVFGAQVHELGGEPVQWAIAIAILALVGFGLWFGTKVAKRRGII